MKIEIKNYYDDLASSYDQNRFGNTYGSYIDGQERKILTDFFKKNKSQKTLDAGCGTGRLLDFATHGMDLSENMVAESQKKFNDKELKTGGITAVPFGENTFDVVYCFHVIMHLDKKITENFLKESHRILKPNGTLIFDFPSKKRRNITRHKSENWHSANHFSISEINEMVQNNWKLKNYLGILFFPIHRMPKSTRKLFVALDNLLCRSFLREHASYLIVELEKK
jgi:ubiquinone/menaquinone biosynthesis C-methylase UbiE